MTLRLGSVHKKRTLRFELSTHPMPSTKRVPFGGTFLLKHATPLWHCDLLQSEIPGFPDGHDFCFVQTNRSLKSKPQIEIRI